MSSRKEVRARKADGLGDEGSDGNHGGFNADEESSVVRLRGLGNPRGDGRGVNSVSETLF